MKLLAQRVTRATAESNGLVDCRIGTGLVLFLGLTSEDTREELEKAAEEVVKLKLWPGAADEDDTESEQQVWTNSIVDSGYEVMVVLQQSLCATFHDSQASEDEAMDPVEAQLVFEEFMERLRKAYQEEMIVAASFGSGVRIETTLDGNGFFDLTTILSQSSVAARPRTRTTKKAPPRRQAPAPLPELEPDVAVVTFALRQLPDLAKGKQRTERERIFKALSKPKFRDSLPDCAQRDVDNFAEALECAAAYFTEKQQDHISTVTGISISAEPLHLAAPTEDTVQAPATPPGGGPDTLDEQLAELREDVKDPQGAAARKAAKGKAMAVKKVKQEPSGEDFEYKRPDLRGRAAPETPTPAASAARSWASQRRGSTPWAQPNEPEHYKGKGKSKGKSAKGKGMKRSLGIVSLDGSARVHGTSDKESYGYGQMKKFTDGPGGRIQLMHTKQEEGEDGEHSGQKRKAGQGRPALPKLAKGTPTIAPMTPAGLEASGTIDDVDL